MIRTLRSTHVPPSGAPLPRSEAERAVSRGRLARLPALTHRLRAWVTASPWTDLAGRAALFAVALLVLAWIGRAATAATPNTSRQENPPPDAGGLTTPAANEAAPPAPPAPQASARIDPPSRAAAAPPHARATVDDPVYVNHASAEELLRLPGVGPKRAQAIVALRQRVGRFQRVEDLLRVKGIGRATIRKWRPLLRLDAPPPAVVTVIADAGP